MIPTNLGKPRKNTLYYSKNATSGTISGVKIGVALLIAAQFIDFLINQFLSVTRWLNTQKCWILT